MCKTPPMYELAKRLFPICRSITGDGVRETLTILKSVCCELEIKEVPSGTKCFDWVIPEEWNVKEAYIEDLNGERLIDFKENNLHVMGYSIAIDRVMSFEELEKHIYTHPQNPDIMPYILSFYEPRFGFSMSENQKRLFNKGQQYHVVINSTLRPGSLTYGEIIIKGSTEEEIFLSTYICHPSMANNELSGPCVTIYLAKWLSEMKNRKYTYRIIFIPETIGSIMYLSKNLDDMKRNITAGFNITCVGDNRTFSYIPSRYGNTLADKAAQSVLSFYYPNYKQYTFLERGSDERQYCSPGVDLPLCSICRSKYGEYPEYHTSADNLDVISQAGLVGAYQAYKHCILGLENNAVYKTIYPCEPQLGKRGLYPTINSGQSMNPPPILNFLAYADGTNDLFDISNTIRIPIWEICDIAKMLEINELIEKV